MTDVIIVYKYLSIGQSYTVPGTVHADTGKRKIFNRTLLQLR